MKTGIKAKNKAKNKGFTLIELMIVIVIISIIMTYAIPSYRNYVLKAKRSEAKNALMLIASLQERYYSNNNKYGIYASGTDDLSLAGTYPTPTTANNLNYLIEMTSDATSYTIKATAKSGQVKDTDCLEFTLDNIGTKSSTTNDCW